MHDRYHPTYVLAPHDDGTWVRATLLSQHRVAGEWRVTVSHAVDGFTYWRGMPASECRAVDQPPADTKSAKSRAAAPEHQLSSNTRPR